MLQMTKEPAQATMSLKRAGSASQPETVIAAARSEVLGSLLAALSCSGLCAEYLPLCITLAGSGALEEALDDEDGELGSCLGKAL